MEGELRPGERLLEQVLAERFGTSRAPIREAIYLLTQEGLVERAPRKGAVVKKYAPREIEEIYKIRITLEELALVRNCSGMRRVRLSLAALEPVVRRMEDSKRDVKRYHELNFEFHRTIVEVSGSSVLLPLHTQLEGPLRMFLRRSIMTRDDVSRSIEDHRSIVARIARADAQGAGEVLRAHELAGMDRALAVLRENHKV